MIARADFGFLPAVEDRLLLPPLAGKAAEVVTGFSTTLSGDWSE